jgi:MoxR-like ATPase
MLSQQLGQLLRVPFSSISCTMGMSESQLTGWLLPVGQGGAFDYVPSPFVTCLQQPSVFLLDELDAADPNVLMVLNSALSNGFITIPHKLNQPTIVKHELARIIAGVNTMGSGADDIYSARAALDGSTMDRFYTMAVDYDPAYEKSLFAMPNSKKRTRSAPWTPSAVAVDQLMLDQLQEWFFTIRKGTTRAKINKIVSSRMAQRAVAATLAGIPVDEVKADLLLGWSDDEKMRAGGAR